MVLCEQRLSGFRDRNETELKVWCDNFSNGFVANPTHRERMLGGDFEPTTSTPEQFAAFIKSETAKWGKVVKASGAKAE